MKILTIFFLSILFSFSLYSQKYFTGLVFDDESYENSPTAVEQSRVSFVDLPQKASLKQFCPKPGNQIQMNTSVGWASAWGARTILEAKKNDWTNTDSITHEAFSPIFSYQLVRTDADVKCTVGSRMNELLQSMKTTGTIKYVDFLEFCPAEIPAELTIGAKNNSIVDFVKLFEINSTPDYKINSVKKSIAEGSPVVSGMYCPASFFKAGEIWQPIELVSKEFPGHAICVVGYDDKKYGGAFEILNSWGRNWGQGGFTWIRYEDFAEFIRYSYEIRIDDSNNSGRKSLRSKVSVLTDDHREIPADHIEQGQYVLRKKFREGDNLRIRIQDVSPCYFYVLGSGTGTDFTLLFPHEEKISPLLSYRSNNLSIPDDQHFIQVTGNEETDYLYLIFSKEPLDVEYLISSLQLKEGKGTDIFYGMMSNKIVPVKSVMWDNLSMSFQADFKNGILVPLIIQFNHR